MNARWRQSFAALRQTPPLLLAQKLLRRVPGRPIDVGKLCFLRLEGVPRVPPALLRGAATVRPASPADLDALAALRDTPDVFRARFASGDRCVVAEADGRVVGFEWFSDGRLHLEGAWGYPIAIPDDYVYAYDAFIEPAYRNTGVWLRFKAHLAGLMREAGKRGVLTFVDYGNWPSWRTHLRFGFKPSDTVLVAKILGHSLSGDLQACAPDRR